MCIVVQLFWVIVSHSAVFIYWVIKHGKFWTQILQDSVAMQLSCGGIFNNDFIANLLASLPVKEFWKSISIWWSYGQKSSVLFFWYAV